MRRRGVCTDCLAEGMTIVVVGASRCPRHRRRVAATRPTLAVYRDPRWRRLSVAVLRAWRGEHGDLCPGYGRAPHVTSDLAADHVVPLAQGGDPFDRRNVGVLCRSCNSRKGGGRPANRASHGSSLRPGREPLEPAGRSRGRLAGSLPYR